MGERFKFLTYLTSKSPKAFFSVFICVFSYAFFSYLSYLGIERLWPDESLYSWNALRLFHTPSLLFSKEIIEFHPPLFSAYLAVWHSFFSPLLACHVGSVAIHLLGIIGFYHLGIKLGNRFLGLFGASAMAFNFLYLSQATHILLDGPLAVVMLYFIVVLAGEREEPSIKRGTMIGLLGVAGILMKWSGLLIIPLMLIYYTIAFPQMSLRQRFKRMALPFSIIIFTALLLTINNLIQLGSLWPDTSALMGKYLVKPFWYYVVKFHNILIIPHLIPFFLYGLWQVCHFKTREQKLIGTWFFVFLVGLSFAPEKDLRYSMLILPSSLLITGIGLDALLTRLMKTEEKIFWARIICILCVLFFYGHHRPRTQKFLHKSARQFIGFKEAGGWIKGHATNEAIVMAGSPRIIRYYSGINFMKYGDRLMNIPPSPEAFEEALQIIPGEIVFVVDYWNRTQPRWIYPVTDKKIKYLTRFNFQLNEIIQKKVLLADEKEKTIPVVWIFKRLKTGYLE